MRRMASRQGQTLFIGLEGPDLAVHMADDVAFQVARDVASEGCHQPERSSPFPCSRARSGKGSTYIPLWPILCHQEQ